MSPAATKNDDHLTTPIVRPRDAASGDYEGVPFVLSRTETFARDHELVREFPHLFQNADADRPEVEQATAAPGEKRGEAPARSKRGGRTAG
jgi:hypothetical protein